MEVSNCFENNGTQNVTFRMNMKNQNVPRIQMKVLCKNEQMM